jgi:hypothetical protein
MSVETSRRIDTTIITDTVAFEGVITITIEDEATTAVEDVGILLIINIININNSNIIPIVEEEAFMAEVEARRVGRPAIDFRPMLRSRTPNWPLCVSCNS